MKIKFTKAWISLLRSPLPLDVYKEVNHANNFLHLLIYIFRTSIIVRIQPDLLYGFVFTQPVDLRLFQPFSLLLYVGCWCKFVLEHVTSLLQSSYLLWNVLHCTEFTCSMSRFFRLQWTFKLCCVTAGFEWRFPLHLIEVHLTISKLHIQPNQIKPLGPNQFGLAVWILFFFFLSCFIKGQSIH